MLGPCFFKHYDYTPIVVISDIWKTRLCFLHLEIKKIIILFILIGGYYFTILYLFCHTSTWIHRRYTHVPHSEPPSLLPPNRNVQCVLHWSPYSSVIFSIFLNDSKVWHIQLALCWVGNKGPHLLNGAQTLPHPFSADSRVWKQKPTKGSTSPSRNWPI